MNRRRTPQSEFDRFMGYRVYPYYLFSWIVFVTYGMLSIREGNAHLAVIIGFPIFLLIFLSLIGIDYIVFRLIKRRNEK